ncbi:MAG: hypothetical protein LUC24_04525 [Bacteroidales bacterium]|nr:hypothetical protein [Bacteroidales bacterium]
MTDQERVEGKFTEVGRHSKKIDNKYAPLFENSKTEGEFAECLSQWKEAQSKLGFNHVFMGVVQSFAVLGPQQRQWLANCIRDIYGGETADLYTKYISFSYDLCAPNVGVFDAVDMFFAKGVTHEYIEDFECAVAEYNPDFFDIQGEALDDIKDSLRKISDQDIKSYWEAARQLKNSITKRKFFACLERAESEGLRIKRLCIYARFLANLNFKQEDWLDEIYVALSRPVCGPDQGGEEPKQKEIPKELCTPAARRLFKAAINARLMDSDYNWLRSKSLLACFCKGMSFALNLSHGQNADGRRRIRWQPFETLFGVKHLVRTMADILQAETLPKDIETVQEIFPDINFLCD